MTSAAVTGANGFIGGRLVEKLIEQGVAVTCLLRGKPSPELARTGASFVTIDIADRDALGAAIAGVGAVYHCAYDWNDEDWNFRALRALVVVCRESGARLVHTSSFVVYDIPPVGELTEETIGTTATCGYGHVKREMDHELLAEVRKGGLAATIVQPTIVYGPRSGPWTRDPAEMLLNGTVVLPDTGDGVCNAVYVDDVVDAMILAAEAPAAIGQRFLISGDPVTWGAFYEAMARAAGTKGPKYMSSSAIVAANRRAAKLKRIATSPRRVLRILANKRGSRKLLRVGVKLLPGQLGATASDQLFGPASRQRGHVHIPDPGHLGFLQGKATIRCDKARRLIGYAPKVDLAAGMGPVAAYIAELTRTR